MTSRENLIEKIKKLLALATSPNENEAKSAMEQAQRLMEKYALSINDTREVLGQEEIEPSKIIPTLLYGQIANVISSCFGCFTVHTYKNNSFALFGYPTNRTVARHAIDTILNQGIADYRAGYAKTRSLAYKNGFWTGFLNSIWFKFKEYSKEIYKYSEITEYAKENFNIEPKVSMCETAGFEEGQRAGSEAQLRPGVSGSGVKGFIS